MTLDGTRTYVLGRRRVAIIDPGSSDERHLESLAGEAGEAEAVILLTHLHPDHAEGAELLAARLGCTVRAIAHGTLADGDVITTDAGDVVALHTPGHTPDHASFQWSAGSAVFCGDLMMGGLDTALVAPPEGNLTEYLASLEHIRALAPRVLYPAHGRPFDEPATAIERYIEHRAIREAQVLEVLARGPQESTGIADAVYGDTVPEELRRVARDAVVAYLEHLERGGRVRRTAQSLWERSGGQGAG